MRNIPDKSREALPPDNQHTVDDFNTIKNELANGCQANGESLDETKSNQLVAAIHTAAHTLLYKDDGAPNALVLKKTDYTMSGFTLKNGLYVHFQPAHLNTGAATLTFPDGSDDGHTAQLLTYGQPLPAFYLRPDQTYSLTYKKEADQFECRVLSPGAMPGTLIPWLGAGALPGTLLMDGSWHEKAAYPGLYAVIAGLISSQSETWLPSADEAAASPEPEPGGNHFWLPNIGGRVLRAANTKESGIDPLRAVGSFQEAQIENRKEVNYRVYGNAQASISPHWVPDADVKDTRMANLAVSFCIVY